MELSLISIKIIISGLDNAGKTSILTAFDKRYNFEQEIKELQPTKKIEYHKVQFLEKSIVFWDMCGQERYRELYKADPDFYFANTNLLLYVIDIQDRSKFDLALDYLNVILEYFKKNDMNVPLIVAFHKFDPRLKDNEELIENIDVLMKDIMKIEQLKKVFLSTSIYDIFSIVQLISEVLSRFNDYYLDIYIYLEESLMKFECISLILFDYKGAIISENYSDAIDLNLLSKLLDSIKEYIIQLKRVQEENSEIGSHFNQINDYLLSYWHQINIKDHTFNLYVLIEKEVKPPFLKKLPKFLKRLNKILKPVLSG
ncbi:MAG: ADP-ribosylation factor-like protein [Candidatus Helarchaeota archaeon]